MIGQLDSTYLKDQCDWSVRFYIPKRSQSDWSVRFYIPKRSQSDWSVHMEELSSHSEDSVSICGGHSGWSSFSRCCGSPYSVQYSIGWCIFKYRLFIIYFYYSKRNPFEFILYVVLPHTVFSVWYGIKLNLFYTWHNKNK